MDYQSLEQLLARIHSVISPTAGNAVAGATDSAAASNPLYLMMMQASQPDIHTQRPASPLPASPTPPVTNGGPMPPAVQPQSGGASGSRANPPSVPISTDYPSMPSAPGAGGAGSIPWWANATGADFGGGHTPMPQPRPQGAPQGPPMQQAGPIPGATGPTSVGGAQLQNPNGSIPGAAGPTSVGGAPLASPMGGAQSQNGSALIQKMLALLQQKAGSASVGNNADPSTFGGSSPYNNAN